MQIFLLIRLLFLVKRAYNETMPETVFYEKELMMIASIKTLENSLYWQRVVLRQSTDPKQKERCQRAIDRLTNQIKQIGGVA